MTTHPTTPPTPTLQPIAELLARIALAPQQTHKSLTLWPLLLSGGTRPALMDCFARANAAPAQGDLAAVVFLKHLRAKRLSRGDRLLPTQVLITPSSVVRHKPRWIGQQEESIHIAHVASVMIDTGLLFSDVLIETSGGANSIRCHGHWKADAVEMKRLMERYPAAHHRDSEERARQ